MLDVGAQNSDVAQHHPAALWDSGTAWMVQLELEADDGTARGMAGGWAAVDASGAAGPLQAQPSDQQQPATSATAAPATKAKKGLTPAQLRASRNFRARRKTKMAEMMQEVEQKQQLVARLEAERQHLAQKAQALEAVVAGSESSQQLLRQLSELAVSSEDSDGSASSGSQQQADADVSRTSSGISAGSHASSAVKQEQGIDPDVMELARHYTHYVEQAAPLLQDLAEGRAGPEAQQQVEQLMADLHAAFHRLAVKHQTKIYQLGSINMQTLTKCEPPPDDHWRRVVSAWQLPAAAVERLLACYDVYETRRAEMLRDRAAIAKALAAAKSATEQDLGSASRHSGAAISSGAGAELASASCEELVAEMDRNLAKEHTLEHVFQNSAFSYLERIDVARLCVLTYPYKHDVHKLVSVMRQPSSQASASSHCAKMEL